MKKILLLIAMFGLVGCPPSGIFEKELSEEELERIPMAEFSERSLDELDDAKRKMALEVVDEAIKGYQLFDENKEFPPTLATLISEGFFNSLPELGEGDRFEYNSKTGEVVVRKFDGEVFRLEKEEEK